MTSCYSCARVTLVTPVWRRRASMATSVERQDRQRASILAVARLLHLVVLRSRVHYRNPFKTSGHSWRLERRLVPQKCRAGAERGRPIECRTVIILDGSAIPSRRMTITPGARFFVTSHWM